ncbi:NAD-binding protein [Halorhabdus utahensis]|nr:NAD-binding protein [Halorhabdus utahensis]
MTEDVLSSVDVVVIGTTSGVRAVAEELDSSHAVVFVTDRHNQARVAERAGVPTHRTTFDTGLDPEAISAKTAFVATDRDAVNLLVAQRLRIHGDVETVIIRVNDSDRTAAFDGIATETVTPAEASVQAVQDSLEAL